MSLSRKIIQQIERIKKSAVEVISEEELYGKIKFSLETNTPLKIKAGFDPTSKDIHLGHTVLLRKLRLFQDLGHRVYFLVGDFTAKIGDPSGKNSLRPVLSEKEIQENARTYTRQAFKILDPEKTKVVFNSQWYKNMSLAGFFGILKEYTIARILERDDFSQRIKKGAPLTLLETIYPLIQGYDSVMIQADVELGGTDQKFNLLVGRHLQQADGQEPQVVITLPLLAGLDGRQKMSKSLGNYIGVTESAKDIFGKVMSISDELMYEYFSFFTDYDTKKVKKLHPKQAKEILAEEIVKMFYPEKQAKEEKQRFESLFSKKEIKESLIEKIKTLKGRSLKEIVKENNLLSGTNELRRLIRQKAVKYEGRIVGNENFPVNTSGILKIGKKKFYQIKVF